MVAKFYFILTWLERKQSAELVVATLSPAAAHTCPSILILNSEFRVNINFLLAASSRNGIINLFCCAEGKAPYEPSSQVPCSPFSLLRSHSRSCFKTFSRWHEKLMKTFIFHLPLLPPTTKKRASTEFSNEKIKHQKIALESGCSRVDSQGDHKFCSIRKYDVIDSQARGFSQFVIS